MGLHVESGSAEVAPKFVFNSSCVEPWGGKHASELAASDMVMILMFCENEGHRQGWNDSLNNRLIETSSFHTDFLGGFPHRAWIAAYRAGSEDQRAA